MHAHAYPVFYRGGKDSQRGQYCSFDSANEFIAGFWRGVGRPAAAAMGESDALDAATGSDTACAAFLDALDSSGRLAGHSADKVEVLIPEARRLLAQGR
mmetsp:Transcript_14631/g.48003  ORF Transcript_14631/g.48003 Transcript_14631/m.48003 type:complete len:99 (-) Transcript_14631:673-969(-)